MLTCSKWIFERYLTLQFFSRPDQAYLMPNTNWAQTIGHMTMLMTKLTFPKLRNCRQHEMTQEKLKLYTMTSRMPLKVMQYLCTIKGRKTFSCPVDVVSAPSQHPSAGVDPALSTSLKAKVWHSQTGKGGHADSFWHRSCLKCYQPLEYQFFKLPQPKNTHRKQIPLQWVSNAEIRNREYLLEYREYHYPCEQRETLLLSYIWLPCSAHTIMFYSDFLYYSKFAAEMRNTTGGMRQYVWFSVWCTLSKGPLKEVFFGKHLGVKIGPPSLAWEAV